MERQPVEWEKTFANRATNKGYSPKSAHAALYQKTNKQAKPNKKWAENPNRHFSKEDILMAKKHMERCSTLLITREMQIKITMRLSFHASSGWSSSKSLQQ